MKHPCGVFLFSLSLSSILAGQSDNKHLVGSVDFFGYKGIAVAPIRAALPLREGDTFPGARSTDEWKRAIRESVRQVIGREPTDVGLVCCDGQGNWTIYIGLPGKTSVPLDYNPAPRGDGRLPIEVLKLDEEMEAARLANVTGNNRAKEDDSQGYTLSYDPTLRSKQLAIREYALQSEALLLRVLDSSSDARQRAVAATALGYAHGSRIYRSPLWSKRTSIQTLRCATMQCGLWACSRKRNRISLARFQPRHLSSCCLPQPGRITIRRRSSSIRFRREEIRIY
jgi:hypothetical protein